MIYRLGLSACLAISITACGGGYVTSEDASPSAAQQGSGATSGGSSDTTGTSSTGGTANSSTSGGNTTGSSTGASSTGTTSSTGGTATNPNCGVDTYSNYAKSFFSSNCIGCHSNFSTLSGISADETNIESNISSGSMPQGKTLSKSDKSRILTWLSCSLPP